MACSSKINIIHRETNDTLHNAEPSHCILTGKKFAINFQESVPCCSTSLFNFSSLKWRCGKEKGTSYSIPPEDLTHT